MSYDVTRQLIKDGDIIFFRGTSFVSKIVQFWTTSQYSHVAIAFWVRIADQDRLMVIETQGLTSRRVINLSYYKDYTFDVVASPKKWQQYCHYALSELGNIKYNYFSAIYIGLRDYLLDHFHYAIPKLCFSRGEICSEFVAKCLDLARNDISPQVLFETLLSNGAVIKIRG